MARRQGRQADVLMEGEMQMKTTLAFLVGVLVGYFYARADFHAHGLERCSAGFDGIQHCFPCVFIRDDCALVARFVEGELPNAICAASNSCPGSYLHRCHLLRLSGYVGRYAPVHLFPILMLGSL